MTPSKPRSVLLCAALLIVLCTHAAYGQSTSTSTAAIAKDTGKPEFPQWARDLRRGVIITFGVFPFMMFFNTFAVDTYRASQHGWSRQYLPWPLKGAGAVDRTGNEQVLSLSVAIVGSVVFALADHLIVRHKRAKAERQRLELPDGELIILRSPWPPEEPAAREADALEETDAAADGADAEAAGPNEAGAAAGSP